MHRTPKRKDSFTKKPFELAAEFKEAGIHVLLLIPVAQEV